MIDTKIEKMNVKKMKDWLSKSHGNRKVMVASDEEWNTIYQDVRIDIDTQTNALIIYGLSGSEII
jgi:hypothetical protein